jgi:hypothetical protein
MSLRLGAYLKARIKLELYYSFYFAIRIFGANIRIVFEYSVPSPSPSESKQHWLRCRCSRSFTSRTNITHGGYRNISGLTLLRKRLINRWNLLYNGLRRHIRAVAAWSKIGRRRTGYERYTRSAVWSYSKCQRQPASPAFPDFFHEWCAMAMFRRPTNETRLLCTSNGALLTLGVHK